MCLSFHVEQIFERANSEYICRHATRFKSFGELSSKPVKDRSLSPFVGLFLFCWVRFHFVFVFSPPVCMVSPFKYVIVLALSI